MTVYYFSNNGSDKNSGTSENQAWNSLAMLSNVKLKPGDTILLERGSEFNDTLNLDRFTGSEKLPLTISAFGTGDAPIFKNTAGSGINALKADYVIVENIAFGETGLSGIKTNGSDYWIIRNVKFENTGGEGNSSGINWYNGSNVLVENSSFANTHGDSIFMRGVSDIVVKDSVFVGVHGGRADNVQILGDNIVVDGNMMVAGMDAAVGKGNLVIAGQNIQVSNNYVEGGGFGIGITGDNAVVTNNIVNDHTKYKWSYGIGLGSMGENDKAENILIEGNQLSDNTFGINIVGAGERGNTKIPLLTDSLKITDNVVHDWVSEAIKFSNVTVLDGKMTDNLFGEEFTAPVSNKYSKSDLAGLYQDNNLYIGDLLPAPAPVSVTLTANGDSFKGAPVLQVYKNSELVYSIAVNASKSSGAKETISFNMDSFDSDDKLSFKFANNLQDKATGGDRNLYVYSIEVDGEAVKLSDADRGGLIGIGKGGSSLNFNKNGSAAFDAKDLHLDGTQPVKGKPLDIADILDQSDYIELQGGDLGVVSNTHNAGQQTGASFGSLHSSLDSLDHLLTSSFG